MKLDKFIKRPVLSTGISIFIVLLGLIGLVSLPITQYPDIAPPTIRVSATYTGANAQTVLNTVIAPLEEEINGVENMTYITSTATNDGSAEITVYFKQGTDPDMAAVNVQNRVTRAQGLLPSEVTKIGVTTLKRQTSMLINFAIYSPDDRYSLKFIENYLDLNMVPELKRINGVGEVNVLGAKYAMRIWLKPEVMAQYHLTPADVINALDEQNIEAAPGQLGEKGEQSYQYILRYKGRLETESDFENIVVSATPDGHVLHLNDIARVELSRLINSIEGRQNGHIGAACMIYQTAGTNATEIVQEIEAYFETAQKDFPPGMELVTLLSVNDFLFASIWEVIKTLLEAFILVFIVTYVFLQNFRSTLIPTIAIPVSLIGAFFLIWVIGFSINLLTLCALVLAIAIVVDDAIVVVEAVQAKLDMGYRSAKQAAIDAMDEISGAIVSITLVMMAVFIPVSFMSGTSGVFYRQMGLTMAFAIGISAINALTLSPALCAMFLKPEQTGKEESNLINRFHSNFNRSFERITQKYKYGVLFFINHKVLSIAIIVVALVSFVFLLKTTPTALVPNEDQGVFFGMVTMPPGTSLENTKAEMHKIDSLIATIPSLNARSETNGLNILDGSGNTNGMFICNLKNWDDREQSVDDVIDYLYANTPKVAKNAKVLYFAPPMIPGYSVSNGFELKLQDKTGGSIDKFYSVSQDFIKKLNARPEIAIANTSFNKKGFVGAKRTR